MDQVRAISPAVHLIDLMPPMPGFEGFLCSYVVRGEKTALIDIGPACCAANLMTGLAALGVAPGQVDYILITHIHLDHAGGLGQVWRQMPQARVVVHERGRRHVVDPARLWESSLQTLGDLARQYGRLEPVPDEALLTGADGDIIDLGRGLALEVLVTPGHATHHLSYLEHKDNRLFVGEASGTWCRETLRPSSPPPFDLPEALASLDKLCQRQPDKICFAHYGEAGDAVSLLRHHRAQLVDWGHTIAASLLARRETAEICARMLKAPEMSALLESLPASQRERERGFIENAARGFLGYFSKYGVPPSVL